MSAGKTYLLDANIFIEAHQSYYGYDICPGFWRALDEKHDRRRLFSIDRVKAELVTHKDELSEWVRDAERASLFKGTADKEVVAAFGRIMNWAQGQSRFTAEAKAEFAAAADGWVVAYALCNRCVVVTHERFAPDARSRVLIPNVCLEFGVDYSDSFEMLRDLKVKFILRTKRQKK